MTAKDNSFERINKETIITGTCYYCKKDYVSTSLYYGEICVNCVQEKEFERRSIVGITNDLKTK